MAISDILALCAYAIKPLLPCILAILITTVIAFVVILIKSRGLWFGKSNFALSLFVELRSALVLKLACAWIKLIAVCFLLISFTQLDGVHYVFVLVTCVGILLINSSILEFLSHLGSIAIQLVGLFAANILCSYISQFEIKLEYIVLYVLIAIIVILYSVYIFISEVNFISVRRSIKIEKTWQIHDEV